MRYAKKIANRNRIRVRRATYRNPNPAAKARTVMRTRDVRESKIVRGSWLLPDSGFSPSRDRTLS